MAEILTALTIHRDLALGKIDRFKERLAGDPAVAIDEDGCCTGCGATATGSAIDRMNHALESERAARLAAESRESALRQALGRAVGALRLAQPSGTGEAGR